MREQLPDLFFAKGHLSVSCCVQPVSQQYMRKIRLLIHKFGPVTGTSGGTTTIAAAMGPAALGGPGPGMTAHTVIQPWASVNCISVSLLCAQRRALLSPLCAQHRALPSPLCAQRGYDRCWRVQETTRRRCRMETGRRAAADAGVWAPAGLINCPLPK